MPISVICSCHFRQGKDQCKPSLSNSLCPMLESIKMVDNDTTILKFQLDFRALCKRNGGMFFISH